MGSLFLRAKFWRVPVMNAWVKKKPLIQYNEGAFGEEDGLVVTARWRLVGEIAVRLRW